MTMKHTASNNLICLIVIASIFLSFLLSGCGNKGPLRLPDSNASFMEARVDRI